MNDQKLSKKQRGFTLVEILVVVAIIAIILGVGAAGFKSMAEGNPTIAAANNLKSAAKEAQQLAKGRGVSARLVIYADPSDTSQEGIEKFARYYGVAIKNGVDWTLESKGEYLPVGAFLDTEKCLEDKDGTAYTTHSGSVDGLVDVVDPGNGDKKNKFYYYEFNPQGILIDPPVGASRGSGGVAPRVIVNEGKIGRKGGLLELKTDLSGELNFRGFYIFRSGKTADITNLKSIVATP